MTPVVVPTVRATTSTAELVSAFAYGHDSTAVRYVPGSGFSMVAACADAFPALLIGRFAR